MGKQPYARKGDSAGVMGRSNWASVVELSKPELVGTLLTLQTALGFTLTLVTIHLMPLWIDWLGWRYAFMPLAVGPFLGVWAVARLRAHPDAVQLAGGRR